MVRKVDLDMTVGDRRPSFLATLLEYPGGPVVTLTSPKLLLVNADSEVVKVNLGAMTIVGPGQARYDWQTADVNEEGDFWLWVRDMDALGLPLTWPPGGEQFCVRFTKVTP